MVLTEAECKASKPAEPVADGESSPRFAGLEAFPGMFLEAIVLSPVKIKIILTPTYRNGGSSNATGKTQTIPSLIQTACYIDDDGRVKVGLGVWKEYEVKPAQREKP